MKFFSKKKSKEDEAASNIGFDETKDDVNENLASETYIMRTREQKIQYAENCCEQMVMCTKRIEELKKEYSAVNHYLSDIQTISSVEGATREKLFYEANRISTLKNDKNQYKNYTSKIPSKKYEYINSKEKELPEILKSLKEDEDDYRTLKSDIHNIKGEQAALKYEHKEYIGRLNRLRSFLKLAIVVVAVVLGGLIYGQSQGEYDYTIGFYITVLCAMLVGAIMLVMYQVTQRDLKVTELKMNKAIGLLNKYTLRYVNLKNRLDYSYEVHGVHSSYELNSLWGAYINAKKEQEAYFRMSDQLYKSMENFNSIIDSLKLYDDSVWSGRPEALLDNTQMAQLKDNLNGRRERLKKSIDYNNELIERAKVNIKTLIEKEPELANDIIYIVDKKSKMED